MNTSPSAKLRELRRHMVSMHGMRKDEAQLMRRDDLESEHMRCSTTECGALAWAKDQSRHMRSSYPSVTPDTFLNALKHLRAGHRPRGIMELVTAQYLVECGEWTQEQYESACRAPAKEDSP